MDLTSTLTNIYTDLELVNKALNTTTETELTIITEFDHETVNVMMSYLRKRLKYRRLAINSLTEIGALH